MNHTPHSLDEPVTVRETASDDELLGVLSNERRRTVLSIVAERSSQIDVERLAREVAARERDESPDDVVEEAVHDVHVALHHVHLPKLADAGLIDHDRGAKAIARVERADGVAIDIG